MEQESRSTPPPTDGGAANAETDSQPPEGTAGTETGGDVIPLPPGKANLANRFVAAIIDFLVAVVLGFIPLIGGLIGAAYWLLRDGLEIEFMDRRSIGKKVMKLRPVRLDGQPMDVATSAKRNWMFALGAIVQPLLFIPFLGWLLVVPVGIIALALGLFEIFKVVTDPEGRRLGDAMAGTKVIEVAD